MPSLSRLQLEILAPVAGLRLFTLSLVLLAGFPCGLKLLPRRLPRRPGGGQLRPQLLGLQLYGCFFSLARFRIAALPPSVVTAHSSCHRAFSRISRAFSWAAGPTV